MKDHILDVLIQVLCSTQWKGNAKPTNIADIAQDLEEAGFKSREIRQALEWLDSFSHLKKRKKLLKTKSARVYSSQELRKIPAACRGFLSKLEHEKLIGLYTRELIIDRMMALDIQEVNFEQLRWVTILALSSQKMNKKKLAWLENAMLRQDRDEGTVH